MKFDIFRELKLDFVGEQWKDCFIRFNYISAAEAEQITKLSVSKDDKKSVTEGFEKVLQLLEEKFVSGKAVSDGKVVDIDKSDMRHLPTDILNKAFEILLVLPEEKKSL